MYLLDILPGIIFSGFLGLAIGNFATNPIYRLPLRESLFARDPYCGDCNAPLKPIDLFPVLSWLSTKGKCRYCGAGIPAAYTLTEILVGALFLIAYLQFDFSEKFILLSFGGTALIMIAMMLYIDNFFSDRTLAVAIMLGMVYRTLTDGTIYYFGGGLYIGVMVGAIAWKLSKAPMARDMGSFPTYMKLLAVAGIWLNFQQLAILLPIVLVASLFRNKIKWLVEFTIIAVTVILPLA
jgi:leader peptidase (prepilin peptidase) / N-methyltransferase